MDSKEYLKLNGIQQEQMLKLITKSFYNDLVNYGIKTSEIINISTHLLDCLMQKDDKTRESSQYYDKDFTVENIKDQWGEDRRLTIETVSITPLDCEMYPKVESWLKKPAIKYSFIALFPDSSDAFKEYFGQNSRDYFCIFYEGLPVGVIGGEHIDKDALKIEMRKFVGEDGMQGKGIGKRATFLFLYYVFFILKLNKVYIHSRDTNISNIKLNSKFGFDLEGIFFEDSIVKGEKKDIVRMGLLRSRWMDIFHV